MTDLPLEPYLLRKYIGDFFPGVELRITQAMGCYQCRFSVWKYEVFYSLTTQAMSHVDKDGTLLATFTFRYDPLAQPISVSTVELETEGDLYSHLQSIQRHLNSIAAAITMAQMSDSVV